MPGRTLRGKQEAAGHCFHITSTVRSLRAILAGTQLYSSFYSAQVSRPHEWCHLSLGWVGCSTSINLIFMILHRHTLTSVSMVILNHIKLTIKVDQQSQIPKFLYFIQIMLISL